MSIRSESPGVAELSSQNYLLHLGVFLYYRWSGRATPTLGEETSEAVPATGERGGL